ncbi:adenine deaminase [Methanobrevibacter cuticularis]|uniref:Adenine deaminase n=1 Tax=Methanobrevibacter cuticularis TaxID=47311 RepID=A0A166CYF9_9EURY|nr:adenine deaminase [Methanobrevibacter cuticularis]KZX14996.1 adenine deaminase [Methanobrevibacter cuticularis]
MNIIDSEGIKNFKANILDVESNEIYPAEIIIENSYFKEVNRIDGNSKLDFDGIIVPGFIDAHIHIESTMLTPSNFAKAVVPYGTTSVIADPHEIANVMGIEGVDFMINDASKVPFDFYFSAPSCVPATSFETSGFSIDNLALDEIMLKDEIVSLGEVMNYVGVINNDDNVMEKLKIAKKHQKPIDGHAPMLSGKDLENYIQNGIEGVTISTDHECMNFDEAIEKKKLGMKIMVREGSSAKNMEALFSIKDRINLFTNQDFFGSVSAEDFENILKNPLFDFLVSDDKDPRDLKKGHLNLLIKKAISLGIDPIEAIKMVTINVSQHYNLNTGIIASGRKANFVLIDTIQNLDVKKTFIDGKLVAEEGISFINAKKPSLKDTFILNETLPSDFDIALDDPISPDESKTSDKFKSSVNVRIIEAIDGEIVTNKLEESLNIEENLVKENIDKDILKLAIVERYGNNNIANAFIRGFNLKTGAIASSVAHDSHNIVVVGTNGDDMAKAVNLIHENQGGLTVVSGNKEEKVEKILRLPIAGLMSDKELVTVSSELEEITMAVNELGCTLEAPFMTLSFMSLLVIPSLKLSDKGLFDVDKFNFVSLFK